MYDKIEASTYFWPPFLKYSSQGESLVHLSGSISLQNVTLNWMKSSSLSFIFVIDMSTNLYVSNQAMSGEGVPIGLCFEQTTVVYDPKKIFFAETH